MPKHAVSAEGWSQTNMEPARRGIVRSRRSIFHLGRTNKHIPIGCSFSYRPQVDDIMRSYTVSTTSSGSTVMDGEDEDLSSFAEVNKVLSQGAPPEIVTWALVDNIIFCVSPSFATHYAYQGGNFWEAKKKDSADELLETFEIPRGICTEWAGRLVIAADDVLYIADALEPFTFTVANVMDPPGGSIRGIHSVNGNLVLCTTNGVYALPLEAALNHDVIGAWQKVSEYGSTKYGQTALHDGVVWGVTDKGLRAVFPSGSEIDINQNSGQRWHGERMSAQNWRAEAHLVPLLDGIALVSRIRQAMYVLAPKARHGSWWTTDGDELAVGGTRVTGDGDQVFLHSSDGSLSDVWRLLGNRTDDEASLEASFSGATKEHTVDADPVLRRVTAAAGLAGEGNVFLSVQGRALRTSAPPAHGVIAGTSQWGDGTRMRSLEVKSRKLRTSRRSDDHQIEVGVDRANVEMRTDLVIEFHGAGTKRGGA